MRGSWSLPRRVIRLPGTRWRSGIVYGWAVASEEFRQNLKKLYAELEEPRGWGGREVAELREEKWEGARGPTKKTGKTEKDRLEARKSAKWKIRIARELRARTTATNAWIAERLAMGHSTRVSNLIRENM